MNKQRISQRHQQLLQHQKQTQQQRQAGGRLSQARNQAKTNQSSFKAVRLGQRKKSVNSQTRYKPKSKSPSKSPIRKKLVQRLQFYTANLVDSGSSGQDGGRGQKGNMGSGGGEKGLATPQRRRLHRRTTSSYKLSPKRRRMKRSTSGQSQERKEIEVAQRRDNLVQMRDLMYKELAKASQQQAQGYHNQSRQGYSSHAVYQEKASRGAHSSQKMAERVEESSEGFRLQYHPNLDHFRTNTQNGGQRPVTPVKERARKVQRLNDLTEAFSKPDLAPETKINKIYELEGLICSELNRLDSGENNEQKRAEHSERQAVWVQTAAQGCLEASMSCFGGFRISKFTNTLEVVEGDQVEIQVINEDEEQLRGSHRPKYGQKTTYQSIIGIVRNSELLDQFCDCQADLAVQETSTGELFPIYLRKPDQNLQKFETNCKCSLITKNCTTSLGRGLISLSTHPEYACNHPNPPNGFQIKFHKGLIIDEHRQVKFVLIKVPDTNPSLIYYKDESMVYRKMKIIKNSKINFEHYSEKYARNQSKSSVEVSMVTVVDTSSSNCFKKAQKPASVLFFIPDSKFGLKSRCPFIEGEQAIVKALYGPEEYQGVIKFTGSPGDLILELNQNFFDTERLNGHQEVLKVTLDSPEDVDVDISLIFDRVCAIAQNLAKSSNLGLEGSRRPQRRIDNNLGMDAGLLTCPSLATSPDHEAGRALRPTQGLDQNRGILRDSEWGEDEMVQNSHPSSYLGESASNYESLSTCYTTAENEHFHENGEEIDDNEHNEPVLELRRMRRGVPRPKNRQKNQKSNDRYSDDYGQKIPNLDPVYHNQLQNSHQTAQNSNIYSQINQVPEFAEIVLTSQSNPIEMVDGSIQTFGTQNQAIIPAEVSRKLLGIDMGVDLPPAPSPTPLTHEDFLGAPRGPQGLSTSNTPSSTRTESSESSKTAKSEIGTPKKIQQFIRNTHYTDSSSSSRSNEKQVVSPLKSPGVAKKAEIGTSAKFIETFNLEVLDSKEELLWQELRRKHAAKTIQREWRHYLWKKEYLPASPLETLKVAENAKNEVSGEQGVLDDSMKLSLGRDEDFVRFLNFYKTLPDGIEYEKAYRLFKGMMSQLMSA